MNNSFFTGMGLGNVDIGIIITVLAVLVIILLVMNILNICSIRKLTKKYNKFMQGKNAKSLENEIIGLFEDNKFMKTAIDRNKNNSYA